MGSRRRGLIWRRCGGIWRRCELDAGCWMLDAGCWSAECGVRILDAEDRTYVTYMTYGQRRGNEEDLNRRA